MELFIEKEFLDNFYLDYNEDKSIKKIVKTMLLKYGSKLVYMDINIDSLEDLDELKNENEFFALMCSNDKLPTPIESIKAYLFEKCNFKQTIVFTNKEENWFKDAREKGALCFSFDTYEKEIEKIISNLHYKVDLTSDKFNLSTFDQYSILNFNKIIITDNYILTDRDNQKIVDNIIQILSKMTKNITNKITVQFFTKELNPISENKEHKKEKAKKKHSKLNSIFAHKKIDFSIIMDDLDNSFNFHDRNILTNFSIIDSGKGFNLIPHKVSNSQIVSETIFEKYTYDRLNRLIDSQTNYVNKIFKQGKISDSKFIAYP